MGEDIDFGMQLRNKGVDIFYFPQPVITHLKAPIGGFRKKRTLEWQQGTISPKPSPTLMLFWLLNRTKEQILGVKTFMYLSFYRSQPVKNPIQYIRQMNKKWKQSIEWAHRLKNR